MNRCILIIGFLLMFVGLAFAENKCEELGFKHAWVESGGWSCVSTTMWCPGEDCNTTTCDPVIRTCSNCGKNQLLKVTEQKRTETWIDVVDETQEWTDILIKEKTDE